MHRKTTISQTKKNEKLGKILGHDSCPYLNFLNLTARIVTNFPVFKVEED